MTSVEVDPAIQLKGTRTLSKYEEKGKQVLDSLIFRQNQHDFTNFYWYQIEAALKTANLLLTEGGERKTNKPVLIVAPTGSGKSGMIVLLPYVLKARKVLVLTPSVAISQQLARAFGIDNKFNSFFHLSGFLNTEQELQNVLANGTVIKDSQEANREITTRLNPLVIVNAQKFGGRSNLSLKYEGKKMVEDVREFFRQFDLLIVDEAHHYPTETWETIVTEFYNNSESDLKKQAIFITATPFRNKGGDVIPILDNQGQRIAFQITNDDVVGKTVRAQAFVQKEVYSPEHLLKDLKELLEKNQAIEPRFKHQAILLVHQTKEAEKIVEELNSAAGDDDFAIAIVRNTRNDEVQRKILDFSRGKYQVAVNCKILSEGYDNTSVTVVGILKRMKSKIMFSQFIGRCMRMKKFENGNPDQSTAVVLSYKEFEQETNFNTRNDLAQIDPSDEGLAE